MPRPRKPAKLQPHQYNLKFPALPVEPKVSLPHVKFHNGVWKLFRSKWKSRFTDTPHHAACLSGSTIPDLTARLQKSKDYRFGYKEKT